MKPASPRLISAVRPRGHLVRPSHGSPARTHRAGSPRIRSPHATRPWIQRDGPLVNLIADGVEDLSPLQCIPGCSLLLAAPSWSQAYRKHSAEFSAKNSPPRERWPFSALHRAMAKSSLYRDDDAHSLRHHPDDDHSILRLALQLHVSSKVCLPCCGLMSPSPHRPSDNISRFNLTLGQPIGDASDLLN